MIVIGKDKVDQNFNILADGTITDLNGNIQECHLDRGRPYFKNVKLHKIQMWTNYGWRDGHTWNIHHLDENKLNNSLSNLVFMTRSEHSYLHLKGKQYRLGHHHSDESKAKMSIAHKGQNTWLKDTIFVNNGFINKRVYPDQIPEGFKKGRISKKNKQ